MDMTVAHAFAEIGPAFPHLRAMQLAFNALDLKGLARNPNGTPRDIFYVTDDVLVDALYSYYAMNGRSSNTGDQ